MDWETIVEVLALLAIRTILKGLQSMKHIELVGIGLLLICSALIYFITSNYYSTMTRFMLRLLSMTMDNHNDLEILLAERIGNLKVFLDQGAATKVEEYLKACFYKDFIVVEAENCVEVDIYGLGPGTTELKGFELEFLSQSVQQNILINYHKNKEQQVSQTVFIQYRGENK